MQADQATETFTPPIRAVRRARGISVRDLAKRTGIDPAHLSRVERGQASLSVTTLRRLATELGLRELAELLAQYDRPESTPQPSRNAKGRLARRPLAERHDTTCPAPSP